jgi:hypothetical protein
MRNLWQLLLDQNHLAQRHGRRSVERIDIALSAMGAYCTPVEISDRMVTTTPSREVERITSRVRDGVWSVPAEMVSPLLSELRARALVEFDSLEQEGTYQERVMLHTWRF